MRRFKFYIVLVIIERFENCLHSRS